MAEHSKKILIVEDEKPLAHVLSLKLSHEGFTPKIATDGNSAMDMLKHETFDLIILDLMMPRMNGFKVLEELKAKENKIPIIVATNLGQDEDLRRVKELGAADYLVKSDTSLSDIMERINKMLS